MFCKTDGPFYYLITSPSLFCLLTLPSFPSQPEGKIGLPRWLLSGKESTCQTGDLGSILGLGRSPGEGKGYSLQYYGLENSMECMKVAVYLPPWVSRHVTLLNLVYLARATDSKAIHCTHSPML